MHIKKKIKKTNSYIKIWMTIFYLNTTEVVSFKIEKKTYKLKKKNLPLNNLLVKQFELFRIKSLHKQNITLVQKSK